MRAARYTTPRTVPRRACSRTLPNPSDSVGLQSDVLRTFSFQRATATMATASRDIAAIEREVTEKSRPFRLLQDEIHRVIVGQDDLVHGLLLGLLANGHILIEGVPGLAKTTAVSCLASGLHTAFQRIQFTPDLLPADLVGTMVYRPGGGDFVVKRVRVPINKKDTKIKTGTNSLSISFLLSPNISAANIPQETTPSIKSLGVLTGSVTTESSRNTLINGEPIKSNFLKNCSRRWICISQFYLEKGRIPAPP